MDNGDRRAMVSSIGADAPSILNALLQQQSDGWLSGDRPAIERLLESFTATDAPSPSDVEEHLMALISNEVALREQLGEQPSLAEYQQRFPQLSQPLSIQWWVDRLLQPPETATVPLKETWLGSATIAEAPRSRVPRQIGRYEILAELGRGAIGVVYKAWDPQLKRPLAIKRLRDGLDADEEALSRIRGEAEAIARIRHPNIVQIYEIFEVDGLPFLAMEYCAGGTLTRRLDGAPILARQAAELLLSIARAVASVHQSRIIHRDLKPGNVLLENGTDWTPKVSDFGLAKLLDVDHGATATGNILGTPAYMAPEQAFGDAKRVGPAADIYSLGALLYECLTGSAPFRGASVADTLEQVRVREPVSIRTLAPKVPVDLETIALKCLRKSPEERYASVQALVGDLENFLADRPIVARPLSRGARMWRWCRHNPRVALLLLSVFGLLSLTALILLDRNRRIQASLGEKAFALSELTIALGEKNAALSEMEEALRRAAANELLARKRFYAAEMNLAQHAFESGETARVTELLEHQRPTSTAVDLRGFEWVYLHNQLHQRLQQTWTIAEQEVNHLCFSPDGHWLAASSGNSTTGQVTLWDVELGQQRYVLAKGDAYVHGVAFSPDGRFLLTGLAGSGAGIWDLESGELMTQLSTDNYVMAVAWSEDGRFVAAGCRQGEAWLWDAHTHERIPGLRLATETITNVVFSRDSQRLYLGYGIDWIKSQTDVYAVGSLPLAAPSKIEGMRIHATSPDDRLLLGVRWGEVYVREANSDKIVWSETVTSGSVSTACFAGDSQRVLRGGNSDRTAEIWDVDSGKVIDRVAHRYPISSVAWDPRGRFWATGSEDGVVNLWRDEPAAPLLSESHTPPVWRMAYSERDELFLGGAFATEIRGTSTVPGLAATTTLPSIKYVHKVSADGQVLLAVTPTANAEQPQEEDPNRYFSDSAAPGAPETIEVWDRTGTSPRICFELPDKDARAWRAVDLSSNGKLLAARQWSGPVRVWDISGTEQKQIHEFNVNCLNLTFSHDGRWLAACFDANRVRVWDLTTSRALPDFQIEPNSFKWANTAEFSQDGQYLAAGNGSGVVRVWEVASGLEVSTISGQIGEIHAMAFFSNSRTLAVAGVGPVRLWDFETGQELISLPVPDYKIYQLAVSADGQTLLACSDHGIIHRWLATKQVVPLGH
ncbi:MAG: serine/threonine-protein kinase [Aureliella sp.]